MSEHVNFVWPNQKSEPTPTDIVTTVKNIINKVKNETEMNIDRATPKDTIIDSPTTIINSFIENNSTEQAVETKQHILTAVADTITSTASSIATTISNTNNNSTVIKTFTESNNIVNENGSTVNTILENITTEANIATGKDIIITTTKKVIGITSNTTDSTLMNQSDIHQFSENIHDESLTVYVILGLLLGFLILIFIALLIIYRKYKKCRQGSGNYCVTQLKEMQSSSSIKTTSDLEDVHVK